MTNMIAKLKITNIKKYEDVQQEDITFRAIGRSDIYPDDGLDENNTYATWTPTADLNMVITNPSLINKFSVDDEFYVSFSKI